MKRLAIGSLLALTACTDPATGSIVELRHTPARVETIASCDASGTFVRLHPVERPERWEVRVCVPGGYQWVEVSREAFEALSAAVTGGKK